MSFLEFSDATIVWATGSLAECWSMGLLSCKPCPRWGAPSEDGKCVVLEHHDIAAGGRSCPSCCPGDERGKAALAAQIETHPQGRTKLKP